MSGCPRTSLAPARWHRTSCQSRGCPTCCRQRNKDQSQGRDQRHIHKSWGRKRGLAQGPVPRLSSTQGLNPLDCCKMHHGVETRGDLTQDREKMGAGQGWGRGGKWQDQAPDPHGSME